ncbi:MAG TPA: alginate lyase family protein [Pyrinomonadaceae bacterium]|jgi:hypothetical protein
MSKLLSRLNKLKGRSTAELRVRGAQALNAYAERRGLSLASRLPTDSALLKLLDKTRFAHPPNSAASLLEHFRARTSPKFFAAFDDERATREALKHHFGLERQTLIKRAEGIRAGRFQLLGFNDLDFGEPVDWHLEPVSRKRSPQPHWSRIDVLDAEISGDKKIVWELNRHQYFVTFGRAYWLTSDERYAETFAAHLSGWMDANPPKLGLNWSSNLEVAFRAISWLWALHFFKDSTHLTEKLYVRALKFLCLHARHLETYLSTYSSPNTHLTGEALGLFYLGTLLPEFRAAARWREKGERILRDELSRHVLADGVYFERASYYHRYTTDFYTHFLILSERNGEADSEELKSKLQSLLDHLMHLARPDGTTPFIGDDDGGQLLPLDEREAQDFRAALATGAALFGRADYKFVAGDEAAEATLWLLGEAGLKEFEKLASQTPAETSRAFPDGGFYVMRDGWTREANYLVLDCGEHGVFNCGHSHADALSFELAARGRTLLVDPGTYTYTGSRELRDYFRSSAAHNTLTIDGESSSVPAGTFSWKQSANAKVIAWKTSARFDYFAGAHDGYMRFEKAPAMHTRSLLFLKNDYWIVRDSIETKGEHRYDLHFHFAAGARPRLENLRGSLISSTEREADAPGLDIFSFGDGGECSLKESWVSSCYGERVSALVCNFSAKRAGAQEFYSFLIPRRAADANARACEIETSRGRAFEIRDEATRDLLLASNGALVETERISSDFKWTWTRFANDAETLEELVLIDGRRFSFDGQEILNSTDRIAYAVARRVDDKLRIEIDDRTFDVRLMVDELVTAASSSINRKSEI